MLNNKDTEKKKRWKKLLKVILVCLLFGIYLLFHDDLGFLKEDEANTTNNSNSSDLTGEELIVYFWDVGQGDSTLFVQGENTMLIDCGSKDSKDTLVQNLKELKIEEIDIFIGTHPHEDHMGELYDVLENFTIKQMYIPNNEADNITTKYYLEALELAIEQEIPISHPSINQTFSLGLATVQFLGPSSKSYSNLNNYSIPTKISFGDIDFMFTGDAESLAENEIIETGLDLECEIMKAGHHGSDTSNTEEFLNAVSPKYVLISVGVGNKYGHPIESVLERFKQRNITLYRTDECGDVIISTDGESINFNCEPGDYKTAEQVEKEYK